MLGMQRSAGAAWAEHRSLSVGAPQHTPASRIHTQCTEACMAPGCGRQTGTRMWVRGRGYDGISACYVHVPWPAVGLTKLMGAFAQPRAKWGPGPALDQDEFRTYTSMPACKHVWLHVPLGRPRPDAKEGRAPRIRWMDDRMHASMPHLLALPAEQQCWLTASGDAL